MSIKSLANDRCSNLNCTLNAGSVSVTTNPSHGTISVNHITGDITYTPSTGFTGKDTLTYIVCDDAPSPKCASAKQIITVYATTITNTTLAADDYITTYEGQSAGGNVKTNDTDPESNSQSVTPQSIPIPGKGAISLLADGGFTFVPAAGFTGPVSLPYRTCDNGIPVACANATLYVMVIPIGTPLAVKVTAFTYIQKNCTVQLNWTTTEDNNLQGYIIENSVNGTDWVNIGMVDSKGFSANRNDYSYIHSNPVKGQNYYRIMLVDKQGSKTYSNVINAGVACSNVDIVVNPNPFTDKLMIYFTSEKVESVTVSLYDNAGKLVVSNQVVAKVGSNQIKLKDLGSLAAGVYVIKVKTSNGTLNQQLVK